MASEIALRIDQLIYESLVKSADIVLQGRGASVTPIVPEEYQSYVSPRTSEYCAQVISPWRSNLTAPLYLDVYIRGTNDPSKRVLMERWHFQYNRRDDVGKDSSRLGLLNRRLITFWRTLYSFVRLLPGFQMLKFLRTQPQVDFEIYNPSRAGASHFESEVISYDFPHIQTPKGALHIGVTHLSETALRELLKIHMVGSAQSSALRTDPIPIHSDGNPGNQPTHTIHQRSQENRGRSIDDDYDFNNTNPRKQISGRTKSDSYMVSPLQNQFGQTTLAEDARQLQSPQAMHGKHDTQSEKTQRQYYQNETQAMDRTNVQRGHSKSLDSKPEGIVAAMAMAGNGQSMGPRRRSESGSQCSQSPPFAHHQGGMIYGTPGTHTGDKGIYSYEDPVLHLTPAATGTSPPFAKASANLLSTSPQTATAMTMHAMRDGMRKPSQTLLEIRPGMQGSPGEGGQSSGARQMGSLQHSWKPTGSSEGFQVELKYALPNSPFDMLAGAEAAPSSPDTVGYDQLGQQGQGPSSNNTGKGGTDGKTPSVHGTLDKRSDKKRVCDSTGGLFYPDDMPSLGGLGLGGDAGGSMGNTNNASTSARDPDGDASGEIDEGFDDDDMPFALSTGRDRDADTLTGCSSLSSSTFADNAPTKSCKDTQNPSPALLQHGVPTVPPPLLSFRDVGTGGISLSNTGSRTGSGISTTAAVYAQLQDFKNFRSSFA